MLSRLFNKLSSPPETPVAMNGVDRTDFDRLEELAATNGPHLVQSPVRIVVEPCWDDDNPPPTTNGFGGAPRALFTIDCSDEEGDETQQRPTEHLMGEELRRNRSRAKLFRQSMSGAHLSNEDREYTSKGSKDFIVATPEEFVSRFGGHHVINKVRDGRAEYIKLADHCVPVPGGSNNHNYANVDLILDIAKRVGAQAVWAGWGHASENPKLPELLTKNRIAFIGPPEKAMWALGDKIASSIVAQTANVPTLPWSGSGLKADWNEEENCSISKRLKIKPELYRKGCVSGVDEGLE
ncbi:unnamed protein product, partial [Ixodes pacificus]